MITFPNCKINLGLNIVSRRANGYHDIETVFVPVELNDVLEIVPSTSGETTLHTYGRAIDCPVEKNLVMKAYRLMEREHPGLPAVAIHLYKHIPDGAGLGGGSSDASFAMKMLNEMYELGHSDEELARLSTEIGADCAFFIYNKPMYATGIGDEFTPVEVEMSGKHLLMVKPDVSVPTAAAYAGVTPRQSEEKPSDIVKLPVSEWRGRLKNDFESSVFAMYPELGEIKRKMEESGAEYASMSGSGSTIYGIYDSAKLAEKAREQFGNCQKHVISM